LYFNYFFYISLLINAFLFLALAFSSYYCYKFAKNLLDISDAIELALDILDERYASISRILEIPLFYDSPEVRQVLIDIERTRNSILKVANILGSIEVQEEDIGQED